MDLDWTQTRRIAIGVGVGFLIGGVGIPMMFPATIDRTVTETVEVEKKVEVIKEVVVEKEIIKEVEKKVYIKQQGREKETTWLPSGEIRLIERESLVTKDSTETETLTGKEQSHTSEASTTTEQSQTAKTTEQGESLRYGIGASLRLSVPFAPTLSDITVHGKARIATSPFWLTGSYSYPLNFNLGAEFTW